MAVEFLEHRTIHIRPNATRTLGSSKNVFLAILGKIGRSRKRALSSRIAGLPKLRWTLLE